jgi:flavoprotein
MVRLWPRKVDLEHTAKLKTFEATTVVESSDELLKTLQQRLAEVG